MLKGYDAWKLQCGLEDEVVVCECEHCEGEIYEGEDVFKVEDGLLIHEDCLLEYTRENLVKHVVSISKEDL